MPFVAADCEARPPPPRQLWTGGMGGGGDDCDGRGGGGGGGKWQRATSSMPVGVRHVPARARGACLDGHAAAVRAVEVDDAARSSDARRRTLVVVREEGRGGGGGALGLWGTRWLVSCAAGGGSAVLHVEALAVGVSARATGPARGSHPRTQVGWAAARGGRDSGRRCSPPLPLPHLAAALYRRGAPSARRRRGGSGGGGGRRGVRSVFFFFSFVLCPLRCFSCSPQANPHWPPPAPCSILLCVFFVFFSWPWPSWWARAPVVRAPMPGWASLDVAAPVHGGVGCRWGGEG